MFSGQGGAQYLVQAPGQLVAIQQPAATFAVASQQQGTAQVTITQGGTVSISDKFHILLLNSQGLYTVGYSYYQEVSSSIYFLARSKAFRTDRRYQRHII